MKKSLYIVTGSSKGLGRALVEQLIQSDQNLVVGISRSSMEEKDNFRPVELDLADTDALIGQLDSAFPEGDFQNVFLINNAGWIGDIASLGNLDPVGIQRIQAINVVAPALLINEFVKRYQRLEGKKVVVNISSGAATKAIDGWSGYCSSKAALNQLSLVAEEESKLKGFGIKYYALSPGIIDTPMQEEIRSVPEENFSNIEKFRSYKSQNQLSSPEEVAGKVIYLLNHTDKFLDVLQDVREFNI
jgi:benzil reductase ((S)-benzoin forming)